MINTLYKANKKDYSVLLFLYFNMAYALKQYFYNSICFFQGNLLITLSIEGIFYTFLTPILESS